MDCFHHIRWNLASRWAEQRSKLIYSNDHSASPFVLLDFR